MQVVQDPQFVQLVLSALGPMQVKTAALLALMAKSQTPNPRVYPVLPVNIPVVPLLHALIVLLASTTMIWALLSAKTTRSGLSLLLALLTSPGVK
jgi:hypothetical protein